MNKFKIIISILLIIIIILLSFMLLDKAYNENLKGRGNNSIKININLLSEKADALLKRISDIYNDINLKSNELIELNKIYTNISYEMVTSNPKYKNINTTIKINSENIYPNIIQGDYLNNRRKTIQHNASKNIDYPMKTSAWLHINDASINQFIKTAEYFDHVHPFLYDIKGRLVNKSHVIVKRNDKAVKRMIDKIREQNPNILIIPTIFRWETSGRLEIKEVIGIGDSDKSIMKNHIKSLIDRTDKFDFDGIDIDYEGMHKNKKDDFTNFIKELRKAIDKYNDENNKNIVLSLSVHPKTWASDVVRDACIAHMGFQNDHLTPEVQKAKDNFSKYSDKTTFRTSKWMNVKKWKQLSFDEKTSFCHDYDYAEQWRGPQTHDYYELEKYADYIKIMAYEKFPMYGYPGPGPQAPLSWIEGITEYAYDHIPSEKVYVGLPTYGYQRPVGGVSKGATTAIFWDTFQKIADEYEYPTKIYRPDDPNWDKYDILKQYNPKYVHAIGGKALEYYEPAIWYEKDGSYRVAFGINGEAFKKKAGQVMKYPVAGFSMWQFTTRNDKRIIEEIKKIRKKPLSKINLKKEQIE